jgi:hypothetical protein
MIQFESCKYLDRLKMNNTNMGLFTKEELQKYAEKFLCGLYGQTGGSIDHSANSTDIFIKNISYGAYERPQYGYQATQEILRELKDRGLVQAWNLDQEVRLTLSGLERCREICK